MSRPRTNESFTYDLIFLFGPPLFDKPSFLPKALFRQDYVLITPSKLFVDNPSFGLRDVSLQIVSELKKKRQVFIEDDLRSANTRKSIFTTVKKKIPDCKALLVKIVPAHGLFQVLWTHQNAHGKGLLENCSCQNVYTTAKGWFDPSLQSVDYLSGFVDAPEEKEGFQIKEVDAQFQVQSDFKCEVPAFFAQWEAAVTPTGDLNATFAKICYQWTALNEHGRIIIMANGKQDFRPTSGVNNIFHQNLRELSSKICSPIYIVWMTKPCNATNFCSPPQPGVLAFLQTQHLIDLQAKHTVYIFETTDHMKMAQAAGVKFVKSNTAYRYPEKILTSLCVIPPVPSMLKDMKVVKVNDDNVDIGDDSVQRACLSLVDKCVESADGFASHSYQNGLEQQVVFPDITQFLKIQETFASRITPTGVHGNKMVTAEFDSIPCTSKMKQQQEGNKKSASIQNLPVWMTRRLNRKSTESSLSGLESDEQGSSFKFAKTVYLMSEKELKEFAIQVIKQAGKNVQDTTEDNDNPG